MLLPGAAGAHGVAIGGDRLMVGFDGGLTIDDDVGALLGVEISHVAVDDGLGPRGPVLRSRATGNDHREIAPMARIRPRRQKGLTLVDAAILLVILGLLAVGTIPVFVRSVQRTRMAEATMNLRKIFDTSVTYFVAHPDGPDDPLHVRQFPDTVAPTPDDWWATVCGDGSARPYPPRPDTWSAPTWKAIGFAIETPFYYEYTYLSRGRGDDASFTARAMGDLDCDGVRSTFERSSPDGTGDGPFPLYSAKPFE